MLLKITRYDELDTRKLMDVYAESNAANTRFFCPDEPDEREERDEHPDDAEHIEQQVRHSRPPRLCIGIEGGQVGRDGSTDVLAHDQGDTLEDGDGARGAQHHRNGHQGRGTLYDGGKDRADEQEQQDRAVIRLERRKEIHDGRLARQVHVNARLLEHSQRKQQERQSEQEITHIPVLPQLDQQDADQERRPHHIGDIERETRRHDPGAHRRADVRAHNDRNGLCQ